MQTDLIARRAFYKGDPYALDFMWYLWCGADSPVCGRRMTTFARAFIEDKAAWYEPQDPYYTFCNDETVCLKILADFGLPGEDCHIINGHTPIRVSSGENPLKDAQLTGRDIHSQSYEFSAYPQRKYVRDTDHGKILSERMLDLIDLLDACKKGLVILQQPQQ